MRFLPVAALVAISGVAPPMSLIEELFRHSYTTLKQQSLDKMSIFGGFCQKRDRLGLKVDYAVGYGGDQGNDGRSESIRTCDLPVPSQWLSKNVSNCLFKGCTVALTTDLPVGQVLSPSLPSRNRGAKSLLASLAWCRAL